jgi:hypothetical protein
MIKEVLVIPYDDSNVVERFLAINSVNCYQLEENFYSVSIEEHHLSELEKIARVEIR